MDDPYYLLPENWRLFAINRWWDYRPHWDDSWLGLVAGGVVMSREETKRAIKVMQAYVDGEDIQIEKYPDVWIDQVSPVWDWDFNYRVKPEPRTIWVNEYDGEPCALFLTQKDALRQFGAASAMAVVGATRIGVKYQEVIDET